MLAVECRRESSPKTLEPASTSMQQPQNLQNFLPTLLNFPRLNAPSYVSLYNNNHTHLYSSKSPLSLYMTDSAVQGASVDAREGQMTTGTDSSLAASFAMSRSFPPPNPIT